ncbi:MAG: hypothetical protein AB1512_28885 [Thermodesulfobacteriota bacterium]
MIYTLTIECVRGAYLKETAIRVIEIGEEASLYALHDAIQDAFAFGRDHLFDFFLANTSSPYAVRNRLTENEEWEDRENDFFRIRLEEIWPTGRKRLYYVFDFGDRWTFEIRKKRGAKESELGIKYPRLIKAIGPNPMQYPTLEE